RLTRPHQVLRRRRVCGEKRQPRQPPTRRGRTAETKDQRNGRTPRGRYVLHSRRGTLVRSQRSRQRGCQVGCVRLRYRRVGALPRRFLMPEERNIRALGPLRFPRRITRISWRDLVASLGPVLLVSALAIWIAVHFVRPAPPDTIVITTGPEGS